MTSAVFCEGTDEEPVPIRKLCEVLLKRRYRCSICGTVRWMRVPGSSPHSIPASQSESSNASATMADGLAWKEFVVGNARCKFAVSEILLWNKRKLSLQMNAILWKLINRIKSGKILTLFTTSTTVRSGPVILTVVNSRISDCFSRLLLF